MPLLRPVLQVILLFAGVWAGDCGGLVQRVSHLFGRPSVAQKIAARQVWDDEQIARAVGFTTSRFQGRGVYDTRRFGDLAQALADAAGDRRAIVYAITPEGFTIHIANGDLIAKDSDMTTITETARAIEAKATTPPQEVPAKGKAAKKAAKAAPAPKAPAAKTKIATAAPNPTRQGELDRAKAAKAAKAAAKEAKPAVGKRAAAQEAAGRGVLPDAPDFSAATHARFRGKLEQLQAMVKAGDIGGLKGFAINPVSSSPKALDRYRNLAVIALAAKAAKKTASAG